MQKKATVELSKLKEEAAEKLKATETALTAAAEEQGAAARLAEQLELCAADAAHAREVCFEWAV